MMSREESLRKLLAVSQRVKDYFSHDPDVGFSVDRAYGALVTGQYTAEVLLAEE